MSEGWSGGCQCGALRFRAENLGRASLCHCRMCQKAFSGTGGLLVTAHGVVWTRGQPKHFSSSNLVRRGFCSACGTPLTFECGDSLDIAIAAFDRAAEIAPVIQLARSWRLPWFDSLPALPTPTQEEEVHKRDHYASIVSDQHPDHDTEEWPTPRRRP